MKKLAGIIAVVTSILAGGFAYAGGWGTTPGLIKQDWLYTFEVQPPGEPPYTARYLVTKGTPAFGKRQTVSGVLRAEDICENGDDRFTDAEGNPWLGVGVPCVFTGAIPLVPESYHGSTNPVSVVPHGYAPGT